MKKNERYQQSSLKERKPLSSQSTESILQSSHFKKIKEEKTVICGRLYLEKIIFIKLSPTLFCKKLEGNVIRDYLVLLICALNYSWPLQLCLLE